MSTTNHSLPEKDLLSTRNIRRAIITVGVLVIVVIGAFSAYYYWDRFHPRGDVSPAEMTVQAAEQAVKENPQDPEMHLNLAQVYYESRMFPKALDQANQVLNVSPEDAGALLIAGLSQVHLEQLTEAIPLLEKFIDLRKDEPTAKADMILQTAYYFVGESYMELGQGANAIPPLESALEITPTDADALYQLALAQQSLGQFETALTYYHKAVRLVPDFTEAYQGMVESYTALDKPGYVEYAQGMQAFGMKDFESAKSHLLNAVQSLPEFSPALLGLGLTYEKLGDLNAAMDVLQQAVALDPHDFAAQQTLGRVQAGLSALESQETSQ
ncbi:MAG: tetratricopeptide repeat protein [Chloroflexi bacterium]|nr:tetratricopeptide repeat protein [Chloroflexota bacterium]